MHDEIDRLDDGANKDPRLVAISKQLERLMSTAFTPLYPPGTMEREAERIRRESQYVDPEKERQAELAQMAHFLRLVRAGKHRGCSTGERAARKLAIAIREHVMGLDEQALSGAVLWMGLCQRRPTLTRDILDGKA